MQIARSWNKLSSDVKRSLINANIYYSSKYEDFEKNRGNSCLYVYNATAIIVITIWKKFFFRWGEMPIEPFYFHQFKGAEVEKHFLDEVIKFTIGREFQWLGASGTAATFQAYPTQSVRIPFGNYIVDLSKQEEEIFSKFDGKCRNMVRRAERDGVAIIHGGKELLERYMAVDLETWSRSHLKGHANSEYMNYLSSFGDNCRIYLAEKENVVQGGALFIFNSVMSYYLYGASIGRPSPGALNLLQYSAMMDFKSEGVKFHNFVGCRINEDSDSKYHGIQRFKRSFGGELVRGYMFKETDSSWLYKLFNILYHIKTHSKKQQGDIIDQEISKWNELN